MALAFKVSLLDERRRHVFLRVYSGRIAEGDTVWNANLRKHEKVSRVLLMHAAQKKRVPSLGAGQIFAVTGLKETRTGDTLSDPGHPVVLERLSAYEPVISQAIEAASLSDRDALLEALARVADEDPSFRFGEDPDTGQLLVSGMGELHLEVVAERLRREFGLAVRTGQPQVLMRETLTADRRGRAPCSSGRRTSSTSSARWRSAWARSRAAAGSASASIRPRRRSRSSRPRCEARSSRARARRPRPACSRATRCRTWRWCSPARPGGRGARSRWPTRSPPRTRCARPPAAPRPVLLEPVMRVEIVAPGEYLGALIGSLDQRKGTILEVADRGAATKAIQGEAPLRRMFGYATELRSLTQGRAVFTMRFDRFDAVG